MTTIETTTPTVPLRLVVVDLYRDIHKGIRAELFGVTERAGNVDPTDHADKADLAAHVHRIVELLVIHAEHEDGHVQPVLERHLPALAEQVASDHERLEARIALLAEQAADIVDGPGNPRWNGHRLYVELASFTSSYLAHQDLEERVIMPGLEDAIGADACLDIHQAVVGSIPPDELATSLAVMLPAMNIDDRVELLGGMQAGAPAEVFAGVWSLATSVLDQRELEALAARLGR
ncbi:hemerythrin domain-containing protein [Acidimicrobiia bacterium EGI L10123]|uniref:hemerythrin domain-containing protein n=1 Tax=Salinilacustrithrix flava TaxID=2957203 RepID=UPI003D7C24EB|nr:hemerythrin domain-containing protein [Acidimicrobiia bacterium EGI L10123]